MVSALSRMLRRDLLASRGLLLAIVAIITLGVMCFVTMQSAYYNLSEAQQRYYAQCRMADFWLDLRKAPKAELDRAADVPGLVGTRSRIVFLATANLPDFEAPVTVQVVSMPDQRRSVINDIVLREGSYFSPDHDGEVIVNAAFAEAHRLRPGRTLTLLLNNRLRELRIVGTALGSEFTYLIGPGTVMPDPQRFGICYIKRRFAEEAFGYQGAANQLVGRFAPSTARQRSRALRQLQSLAEPFGLENTTQLPDQVSNKYLSSEIEGLGSFAAVIPTIFLAVAALVLNVLVNRLVRQQRTVIGTLKALGYENTRLAVHYLTFGLVVGLAGGLLGGALGHLAAAGMTSIYQRYFEFPDLRSSFHWGLHFWSVSLSLACAMLGSLRGAAAVMRLRPAESMRTAPPKQGRRVALEQVIWLWSQLSSGWRLAIRNMVRQRYRTAAGVFAAAMGAGLLVTGFMMLESQSYLIDFEFYRVVRSDIDVTFDDHQPWDALPQLRRLPGVLRVEPRLDLPCTFRHGPYHRRAGITGLQRDARLTVPRSHGLPIRLPASGLVIGQRLAGHLHVQPGDWIEVTPTRGRRETRRVRVAQVTEGYLGMSAYAEIGFLSRVANESWLMNSAQLRIDGSSARLAELYRQLKTMPAVRAVVSRRDMIRGVMETVLASQSVFIGVLVAFSGSIFFGSIVNASIVSLAERQREVATMRAMGYGPWHVGAMFLRESLLVNSAGVLLGLPFGYLLLQATAMMYESDLFRLPVVSAHWIWGWTALLGLLFTLLAHGVVQRTIHRMDFLEALKTKE